MNDQAHAAAYSDRVLQQSSADQAFVALLRV